MKNTAAFANPSTTSGCAWTDCTIAPIAVKLAMCAWPIPMTANRARTEITLKNDPRLMGAVAAVVWETFILPLPPIRRLERRSAVSLGKSLLWSLSSS